MSVASTKLHSILQHELNCSQRYRRYMSLLLVHSSVDQEGLERTVDRYGRDSDVMVNIDDFYAVVMSETDHRDALHAIDRYGSFLGDHLIPCYSLATFPADDHLADGLLYVAKKRLQRAKCGTSSGRIMTEG